MSMSINIADASMNTVIILDLTGDFFNLLAIIANIADWMG